MDNYNKNTKILRKFLSIRAINFNSFQRKSIISHKLCFDERAKICIIRKSSISHHKRSYDYENDNKNRQKKSKEKFENNVKAIKTIRFSLQTLSTIY